MDTINFCVLRLSVTRAELPMAELLNGSTSLDLEGKGLGRTEMAIAAQILRRNHTLRTLKISDNSMGRHGLMALTDALVHALLGLAMVLLFLFELAVVIESGVCTENRQGEPRTCHFSFVGASYLFLGATLVPLLVLCSRAGPDDGGRDNVLRSSRGIFL